MSVEVESVYARVISQVYLWGSFVRFSHSVFALPFALAMLAYLGAEQRVSWTQLVLIVLAVVAARTAAMSFNRIVDAPIDSLNPRTNKREIPAGKVSYRSALFLLGVSSLLFIIAAGLLGVHCLVLSPLVLGILFGYSLTKRFTSLAHFVLGIALACAPGGVWYAITATFALLPIWMMLGVLFWVAGFDILYALQDESFDKKAGLHSIPARFGVKRSLLFARSAHFLAMVFFVVFGLAAHLGFAYTVGLVAFAWMLFSQHRLIRVDTIDQIEATFFNRNAWGSVIYCVAVVIDVTTRALG